MKLNLDLKYKTCPKDENKKELTPPQLTRLMLSNFIAFKFGDKPMPRNDSRIWGKIQDLLADNQDTVTLDGTQFDWLNDIVKDQDLPQNFATWLWVVRDYFESVKNDSEKEPGLTAVK